MMAINPVTDSVSELAYESLKSWRNDDADCSDSTHLKEAYSDLARYVLYTVKVVSTELAYAVLIVVSLIEWIVKVCLSYLAYLFRPRVGNNILHGAILSVAVAFESFVALIENIFCKKVGDIVSSVLD